jgi:hypothetical protein
MRSLPATISDRMKGDVFRRLTCFLALLTPGAAHPAFAQDSDRPIHAIGYFSNMRFTKEHAYGYAVELWRDGDSAIGLFFVSEGLQGDTPTGMLENVRFNSHTGALSFTAKLTSGAAVLPGGRQEPSRDLFEFSGTLKDTVLIGTLKRSDLRRPSRPGSPERVQLKIHPQAAMLPAGSYAEWKRQADEILKLRGPKW